MVRVCTGGERERKHDSRPHRRDVHSTEEQNEGPVRESRLDVKHVANRVLERVERERCSVVHLVAVAVELHNVCLSEVLIDV